MAETLLVKDKGLSSTRHPVYVINPKYNSAIHWCELANEKQLGKPWSYRLLPDDAVQAFSTLAFMLGMAIKDLSC